MAHAFRHYAGLLYRRSLPAFTSPYSLPRPKPSVQFQPTTFRPVSTSAQPSRHPPSFDIYSTLKLALGITLSAHVFATYFYTISWTWGISMVPTMAADGVAVLISKHYRRGRDVHVGDLVTFKHPLKPDMRAIKRVVGLEGDFVVRDSPHAPRGIMIQVPKGHCYVVGDNLEHSRDSRMFGPLPMALIKGKVICSLSPWPRRIPGGLSAVE